MTALAVAMTWAVPPDPMIAVTDERLADAPSAGLTVNVTTPPATGSTGSLAVTVTARGAANAVVVDRALRRAAGDRRQGEPLALEGPDVDGVVHDPRLAALVGADPEGDQAGAAGVDGEAAGEQGHGRRRAAIVASRRPAPGPARLVRTMSPLDPPAIPPDPPVPIRSYEPMTLDGTGAADVAGRPGDRGSPRRSCR